MRLFPDDFEERGVVLDTVYTNRTHELDESIAAKLAEGNVTAAPHTALDFHGYIWFHDGCWHEAVQVYKVHKVTFVGSTIREVIEATIEEFGRD